MLFATIFALFLFICPPPAENANILFIAVSPSVSHQIVFQAVWKELSLRGHKVHVITPNPLNDSSLTNLTEIDVSALYADLKALVSQDVAKYILKKPDFLTVFLKDGFVTKLYSKLMEICFEYKNVQEFLAEDHQFDVAIIEWLYPTMAAFGAKYNCPIIGISSLGVPIPALDTVGNPAHPAYAPDHNLPVSRDMSFKERLMSSLYAAYVRIYYHLVILPREDALARRFLGNDLPYLGDIERNVSLLLVNRNPIFHRIYPIVPAIIELGGIQLNKSRPGLEPDLKKFVDGAKNGVVYFSLGSNMRSIFLPEGIKNILLTTFAHLPFDVVWKWEEGNLPGKPPNVFTQSWIPQLDLLAHPNVKLFITQGGLQSTEDAIKNHVPIIGIPFHSDQTTNVDTCVKYEMGIGINIEDLTVENLNASIHEIMGDKKYGENAKKLDQLMHDLPKNGLERAVWWTEYVIRHKGARHLRSHAMDVSWFHFLMLDVIAFVAAVLFGLTYISYKIIKITCRGLNSLRKRFISTQTSLKKTQ